MDMPALEVQGLTKIYRNGVKALRSVDLEVKQGDFFALLGPNGAGKSTLIGILTSLVNKTSGTAKIFGYDIDKEFSTAKSCIGVVPQEFNMNIFDTVQNTLIYQAGYYGLSHLEDWAIYRLLYPQTGAVGKTAYHDQLLIRRHETPVDDRQSAGASTQNAYSG